MAKTPQAHITDSSEAQGLSIERYFTSAGQDPFATVEWELRDARIGHGGKVSFEQTDVEFPKSWSQNSTNIVAQKYFRGRPDSPERERSVKQMASMNDRPQLKRPSTQSRYSHGTMLISGSSETR